MINKQTVLRILEERKARLTDSLIDDALEVELDVLINKISNLPEEDDWILVEKELPEKEYDTVLVVTDADHYCVAVYTTEHGFRTGDIDITGEIIAWMPLPEPYQTE